VGRGIEHKRWRSKEGGHGSAANLGTVRVTGPKSQLIERGGRPSRRARSAPSKGKKTAKMEDGSRQSTEAFGEKIMLGISK